MNKDEFMNYLGYLRELFPYAKIPSNNSGIKAWYSPYINIPIEVAYNMADTYLQEEDGSFNYARLLSRKNRAFINTQDNDNKEIKKIPCKICDSLGFIEVETLVKVFKKSKPTIYTEVYRCNCKNGDRYRKYKAINTNILNGKVKDTYAHYKIQNKK